jgi:hypothetical protein
MCQREWPRTVVHLHQLCKPVAAADVHCTHAPIHCTDVQSNGRRGEDFRQGQGVQFDTSSEEQFCWTRHARTQVQRGEK